MQSRKSLCKISAVLVAGFFALIPLAAQGVVMISGDATQNMSCSGGVCSPTASDAVLNVTDLENLLDSGSLEVTTTGSGGVQAGDVEVEAALSWSNQSALALDAQNSVTIDKKISVAGRGGLSLVTGGNGTLLFGSKGKATFADLSSDLAINGTPYTLENGISGLASAIASNPAGSYALANNYDASQDGTYANSPIATELTGTVQGLGNTISNLSIYHKKAKTDTGLFADVGASGSIMNFRLRKLNIWSRFGAGGLVGYNRGSLSGDETQGVIDGRGGGGGGLSDGNIGTITKSSADVQVKGNGVQSAAGGLSGGNQGTISLSHASGNVNGYSAGGLVGENVGDIDQSFATGKVAGGFAGGLAGSSGASITNSYSTGAVGGKTEFDAGLASDDEGTVVTSSYSTGAVKIGGGFVCQHNDEPVFTNDYWDTTTSGKGVGTCHGDVGGVTGLTSKQLKSGLPSGFDPGIWAEDKKINNGFPYLINNPPAK
jgi:hypothetical protein